MNLTVDLREYKERSRNSNKQRKMNANSAGWILFLMALSFAIGLTIGIPVGYQNRVHTRDKITTCISEGNNPQSCVLAVMGREM